MTDCTVLHGIGLHLASEFRIPLFPLKILQELASTLRSLGTRITTQEWKWKQIPTDLYFKTVLIVSAWWTMCICTKLVLCVII